MLFLSRPALPVLEELSRRLDHGVVVCLTEAGAISLARREALHLENVLFVLAGSDEIPWQDGYFNWVVGPEGAPMTAEVRRVLHPEGRYVAGPSGSRGCGVVDVDKEGSDLLS